jgi:saccharopine dehydrogenase-like NADP-dependent oxidoreductase
MNILVLGAGKVGRNIAKNLARQTFDVCIVDEINGVERAKLIEQS